MSPISELTGAALRQNCDWQQFAFETTDDLADLDDIVGQPRAMEAVQFGIGIQQAGYNLFAMGAAGTGKRSLVMQFFNQVAADNPVPPDWCYVNNFKHPHEPNAVRLPAGLGTTFQKDLADLVEDLRNALSAAFESEDYRTHRQEIEEGIGARQEQAFEEIEQKALAKNLALMRSPEGIAFAPLKEGKVIAPEEFQALPPDTQQQIEQDVAELKKELQRILMQQPRLRRELREQVQQLDHEIAGAAISGLIDELREKYKTCDEVDTYLSDLLADVIENVKEFLPADDVPAEADGVPPWAQAAVARAFFDRYQVNLIVNSGELTGAPVIYEDNPTYQNLIGRVEYVAQMGALTTDFTQIKPGALHRANGGYLVLDARKVLSQPFAWEGLKRALQAGCIRIESPQQMDGLISTVSLEPEPIPLQIKVALLGDRQMYYALHEMEPEFPELFKVVADFDEWIERTPETEALYAQLIASLVHKDALHPFDRTAVACVVEQSARMTEDADRLTVHMRGIADLLHEADYWAGTAGREIVTGVDVQRAIQSQIFRLDRMRERTLDTILENVILIDTQGAVVGQVNGLSVIQLGEFSFGHPSRITARVRLGTGEVVDIDREVEMSGPIHSKGVLIMAGFLGGRYAAEHPLSLAASLVFEQLYGGVDGDSASSAELYALLSAIGDIPINQSFAVTGSVNQFGQVQAIGGVNEKIEGFFDVCKGRGLTGEQGVLIPASNVRNLMLRHDVIEAVKNGQFHIYPVETIDQGIELLTGMPAGKLNTKGRYPVKSVNGKVQARLAAFANQRAEFKAHADS